MAGSGEKFSGVAAGSIAAGALFLYAAIKGYSIPNTIKALIQGKTPAGQAQTTGLTGTSAIQGALNSGAAIPGITAGIPAGIATGGSYNTAMLQQLWQQAGGSAGSAPNAACHAMQESGGRPSVTSANPDGGTNVGLWQLDTRGVGSGYTVAQLQNPLTNAQITVRATGNGANWGQWATPGC